MMIRKTRIEQILDVPVSSDAVRQWPQSNELTKGLAKIDEVESHFEGFRWGIGRRMHLGNILIVEWTSDYGDGKLFRNITVAEIENGEVKTITDYWGAPSDMPEWRKQYSEQLSLATKNSVWPAKNKLAGDKEN